MSADGINRQSTDTQPIAISDGFHCSDLRTNNAIDPTVKAVQDLANQYFTKWHGEWHVQNGKDNSATQTPSMRIRSTMDDGV